MITKDKSAKVRQVFNASLLVFMVLIQGACGIDVTVSGSDGGGSSSASMNIIAAPDASMKAAFSGGWRDCHSSSAHNRTNVAL